SLTLSGQDSRTLSHSSVRGLRRAAPPAKPSIRSLTTGRARFGLAFDWLMPYVTAGGALVTARDDLTVTVGGLTGSFPPLSGTTLGWTAGTGVDVALSSNWSARLEYLHIRANG